MFFSITWKGYPSDGHFLLNLANHEWEFTFNCNEITLLTEKYTQSICNEAKETICSYFFNSKSILASKRCHRWRPSKGAMDAITTIDWEEREREIERGFSKVYE